MAKKTLSANLSVKSLNTLISELEQYRDDLPSKCKKLVKRLAEEGIKVAEQNTGNFGKYIVFEMKADPQEDGCRTIILAYDSAKIISSWQVQGGVKTAEVSPTLMAEFGSGFGAENPMQVPGVGQGTFPDSTHSFDSEGWYWRGLDGELYHSKGIVAKQPMYKASLRIREAIDSVAKEVFG